MLLCEVNLSLRSTSWLLNSDSFLRMDFFEHQERAKRNTLLLSFVFAAAVVLIIAAVYSVLAFFFIDGNQPVPTTGWLPEIKRLWDPEFFLWTTFATLAVILTGTVYKTRLLSSGGEAVARMFGATRINPQTSEPAERRLLNVVDEIAIASGMPAPSVYVLDEESINAFAAGFSTRDAIIGVTRGCMNMLSRDELQSVIAHEFSHILNGDMRLNIRLMGILHGILLISLIGWWVFRISSQSSPRSGIGGTARKKGGNTIVFILAGLCLMIIGYIGVFFARLIKSAVSRQREFLADAASVQFTRNPEGMTGALKKIGGLVTGGKISNPNAEDASHFFFADGLKQSFFNIMSTHPPLSERIRRIDPSFNGKFPATAANRRFIADDEVAVGTAATFRMAEYGRSAAKTVNLNADSSNFVGILDAESLKTTGRWLAALPPAIRSAAREPVSAQALIMAMLVSENSETRNRQMLYLKDNIRSVVYDSLNALVMSVKSLPDGFALPLADMASSTLRTMPKPDLNDFAAQIRHIVESDGTITLFEYMTQALVSAHIRGWIGRKRSALFSSSDIKRFLPSMNVVISTLAYYGNNNDKAAEMAFAAGIKRLPVTKETLILPKHQCGLQQTDRALAVLNMSSPGIKNNFLDACCACVAHDGKTSVSEAELLRAVAAILDCPVPPFLPDE